MQSSRLCETYFEYNLKFLQKRLFNHEEDGSLWKHGWNDQCSFCDKYYKSDKYMIHYNHDPHQWMINTSLSQNIWSIFLVRVLISTNYFLCLYSILFFITLLKFWNTFWG